ncbi:hypothetical protein NMG60_11003769 [Bertholletia excelsa]
MQLERERERERETESMKEKAKNIAASVEAGAEKTKAAVQEMVEKITARDPAEKVAAEQKMKEKVQQAEDRKWAACERNVNARRAAEAAKADDDRGGPGLTRELMYKDFHLLRGPGFYPIAIFMLNLFCFLASNV